MTEPKRDEKGRFLPGAKMTPDQAKLFSELGVKARQEKKEKDADEILLDLGYKPGPALRETARQSLGGSVQAMRMLINNSPRTTGGRTQWLEQTPNNTIEGKLQEICDKKGIELEDLIDQILAWTDTREIKVVTILAGPETGETPESGQAGDPLADLPAPEKKRDREFYAKSHFKDAHSDMDDVYARKYALGVRRAKTMERRGE